MKLLFLYYAAFITLVGQHFSLFSDEPASYIDKKLYSIKHTQSNFDQELAKVKERVNNQELTLESMQQEVTALLKSFKQNQTSHTSSQEAHLKAVEKNVDKLVQDLKQLKNHTNEATSFQKELQKKILDLDQVIHLQGQEIQNLESAVKSLALAIQGKASPSKKENIASPSSQDKTYTVKAGDTLEKIAKTFSISVDALKEHNHLQKDTIRVGQELQIP